MPIFEKLKISDAVRIEVGIGEGIYRIEFEKYRDLYLKDKSEHDLIFCFIFLQIYIECFLHQNMRRIIEFEFKRPRENVVTEWTIGEDRNVGEKIESFCSLFFTMVSADMQENIGIVKDRFHRISYPRNKFAHGHKVASWSDFDGTHGISEARSLLTIKQLDKTIKEANELGSLWNELLDRIFPTCKSLGKMEDFKFKKI